ncbi:MAG: FKBP-type peptidyl-prolyl cis-trans isomerase [Tannerellaceae bacterium]|nr:FKBP-type peptidyl-prolyl cis-trans isomerase [Tannerellaceae bacterium]
MKKYLYLFLILLSAGVLFSCGDDDDDIAVDEEWKVLNDTAFQEIANNPDYTRLQSLNNNGFIYYKVLTEGTGTKKIYYNSTVDVYYKGWFIDGTVFDEKLEEYAVPATWTVNSRIPGWITALQYMVEGDEWEICIPQQLAYGSVGFKDNSGNVVIKPYSTLIFSLKVVGVTDPE